jgi:Entner-Doudoroff aldolase
MSRDRELFERLRCSAILRTSHAEAVAPAMRAAVEGGFRIIEFTLTTPGALDHIRDFARDRELLVGAGTVLDLDGARGAKDAGAHFLVAPNTDPEVIGFAKQNGMIAIPGAYTPTEMMLAHASGADFVKLFPGPVNGPEYVRTVLGPLPFLKLFPTSGVTLDNVAEFLAAGAYGVGFVNCLFDPEDMRAGRFDAIRERARRMCDAVASHLGRNPSST